MSLSDGKTKSHVTVSSLVAKAFSPNPHSAPFADHIDRDRSNNAAANLRRASPSQNAANSGPRASNRSGFKGVSFFKLRGVWRATVTHLGKQKHLGYFESAKDAAKAYDKAAASLFGEFAYLNFPEVLA